MKNRIEIVHANIARQAALKEMKKGWNQGTVNLIDSTIKCIDRTDTTIVFQAKWCDKYNSIHHCDQFVRAYVQAYDEILNMFQVFIEYQE